MRQQTFGVLIGLVLTLVLVQPAPGLTTPIPRGMQVRLDPVASIPGTPLAGTDAGDGSGRFFVTTQEGVVRVVQNGELVATEFLDVRDSSDVSLLAGGERGLLGLAFHPNYAAPSGTEGSGLLYTYTSETRIAGTADFIHPEDNPTPGSDGGNHHSVIREWQVSATDPTMVDTDSSRVLMRISQPQSNHNGGDLAFGPDDNLYIALGDGGGGNDFSGNINSTTDGHTNPSDGFPGGNGLDVTNVFGSILRIDPLGTNSDNGQYGVPVDNPFTKEGDPGVDEIFAYGLRNPYRMSFDSQEGDLYAGDVGQGSREEIDLILKGGNYGWVSLEGTRDNNRPPVPMITEDPIGEYSSASGGDGAAVIGGFVYRGSKLVGLTGKYVFGDFVGSSGVGRLYYLDLDTGEIREFTLGDGSPTAPGRLTGLGQDQFGELYYLFNSGDVFRIVPEPSTGLLLGLGLLALSTARSRRTA